MIISRTPYRISFFGGGTDYPAWYMKNGGEVLSTTIDKYCYISSRYLPPFFDHKIRVVWSQNELCQDVSEIKHSSVRETLKYLVLETQGLEIYHQGDLPARSGVGSSSAFTVGLVNAICALQGKVIDRHELAEKSIYIEQDLIKETVGSQDQISAAYGGFNNIRFSENGSFTVNPMEIGKDRINELNQHIMLFFTGVARTAEKVAKSYVVDIETKKNQLYSMREMVGEAISILTGNGSLEDFGKLLHEAWLEKSSLSKLVSNPYVDAIYSVARENGALGGKLCGAGGGGFMLLFVPPEKQHTVKKKFDKLVHVPFDFEQGGTQIIFHEKQKRYFEEEESRAKNQISSFIDLKNI